MAERIIEKVLDRGFFIFILATCERRAGNPSIRKSDGHRWMGVRGDFYTHAGSVFKHACATDRACFANKFFRFAETATTLHGSRNANR